MYLHFLFWFIYYAIEFTIEMYSGIFTKTSIIRYLLGILLFYVLMKIFKKEGFFLRISLFSFIFFAFILISLFIKYETINLFQNFTEPTISVQILYIIDNFFHLFFIAFIYNIYKNLGKNLEKSIAIENQLLELETSYLNSKIDTHFFFNSVNVFFSQFLGKQSKSAIKLIQLSKFVKKNL